MQQRRRLCSRLKTLLRPANVQRRVCAPCILAVRPDRKLREAVCFQVCSGLIVVPCGCEVKKKTPTTTAVATAPTTKHQRVFSTLQPQGAVKTMRWIRCHRWDLCFIKSVFKHIWFYSRAINTKLIKDWQNILFMFCSEFLTFRHLCSETFILKL